MLIKILPGEYLFSEQGFHVLDSNGFARLATEEVEVEITDETQLAVITAYHETVRPAPPVPEQPTNGDQPNG